MPEITDDDISEFRAEHVLHCKACMDELPPDVSPRDYARLSFGSFRKEGEPGIYLQLWCDRHEANVTTILIGTEEWWHRDDLPLRVKL